MRRIRILFFWLFKSKNNVKWTELISFLFKPTVDQIAKRYIDNIELQEAYQIHFSTIPHPLYWPKRFPIEGVYQVTSETFDQDDWHYYQKKGTQIEKGEQLLDIGTAEGLFSLTVAERCERLILVEPNPDFVEALEKTFRPFSEKVKIIQSALGDRDRDMYMSEGDLAGQLREKGEAGQKIQVRKVDSLITSEEKITYLKADIEGYEWQMLTGAKETIQRNKPKIAITSYHTENIAKDMIELVLSYVPEYRYFIKGIHQNTGKPVMIHFYL